MTGTVMRRIAVGLALVALITLAVVGSVVGSTAARPSKPAVRTSPVTETDLVCPNLNGTVGTTRAPILDAASALSPPSQSGGTVTVTSLGGSTSKVTTIHPTPSVVLHAPAKTSAAVAISANGPVAATLGADEVSEVASGLARGLAGVRCEAPEIDWWFAGADGRVGFTDVLTLSNPNPTTSVITVSMWDVTGPVTNTQLEEIRVPALSAVRIPIATAAPDAATVMVHVHATSGAISAALIDRRTTGVQSDGTDYLPSTNPPARRAVVTGFFTGAGNRFLVIGNPGEFDATVNLRIVSRTGSFTPAGLNQVVVDAGTTKVLNVEQALGGTTGAVSLTSDHPVVTEGLSQTLSPGERPDFMWLAATPPLTGPAVVADGLDPDGGACYLLLAAPAGAAQVRVNTPTGASLMVSVPAGETTAVNLAPTIASATGTQSFVVTPIGAAPVYGTRVLYYSGAHGALITSEPLVGLPGPIQLPPVRQDPRTATK